MPPTATGGIKGGSSVGPPDLTSVAARKRGTMRRSVLAIAAGSAAVALATTGLATAHRGISATTIEGAWGFFEEFRIGDRYGTSVGIARFDGEGGCTMSWTENGGAHANAAEFESECTYELGRGGRGSISGTSGGSYSFVVAAHGRQIYLMRSSRGSVGWGKMRRIGDVSVARTRIVGRWGEVHPGQVAGSYETSVGVWRFNDDRTCVGNFTVNGGLRQTGAAEERARCEYTIEADGRGTMTTGDYFVVTDSGEGIFWMHGASANVGWGEMLRI